MTSEMLSVVALAGVIDVRSVQDSFEKLRAAAATGAALHIDLAQVTEADLTFLQLIESARRTAREAGTVVRLSDPAPDHLRETLRRAGFLSDPPDERTRFWLGETGTAA